VVDNTTLELRAGARQLAPQIEFDSTVGAVLTLDGTEATVGGLRFDYGIGEIDLPNLSVVSPTVLTVNAAGRLRSRHHDFQRIFHRSADLRRVWTR